MAKLSAEYKLNEEQLKQLKQIVPEAFKDNILDFNSLYEALSDFLEDDDNYDIEKFGLSWPGKRQAKRTAAIPPVGTLATVPGDGVDESTTKNIYIEGDNLEVQKILRKAYTGRIKLIYIDPPYNTGNDFIYPDDFSESAESFQKRTGQLNENNEKMSTNNRSDGRFHSKWCSMIYPRLRLARELLCEEGVIFISIDDNEAAQLRKICDEIFGEENFIAQIIWERAFSPINLKKHFSDSHDYIICYAINYDQLVCKGLPRSEEADSRYNNPDNDPRGNWASADLSVGPAIENNIYEIVTPSGRKVMPPSGYSWRLNKSRFSEFLSDNRIYFGDDGNGVPRIKRFLSEVKQGITPMTIWKHQDVGHSQKASQELKKLFNDNAYFTYPKSVELIKRILELYSNTDSIILDFFSGSSTTAHAVMQLNAEDGGNRKFIMVQLAEPCKQDSEAFKAGFKNICEIGKERIRRAGKKIKEEAWLNAANLDTGFKVYRLAHSNYKAWKNYKGTDVKQLEELFKEDSLVKGWKEDDLLTEIMLLEGFPLDSEIELLSQFRKNKIKKISSNFHENALYICLDKDIEKETIETLNLTNKERFICIDSAIDDQSKIRLEDKNLIKTL